MSLSHGDIYVLNELVHLLNLSHSTMTPTSLHTMTPTSLHAAPASRCACRKAIA